MAKRYWGAPGHVALPVSPTEAPGTCGVFRLLVRVTAEQAVRANESCALSIVLVAAAAPLASSSRPYVPPGPAPFHVKVALLPKSCTIDQVPPGGWTMNRYCGAPTHVALPVSVTCVPVGCGDVLSVTSAVVLQDVSE